MSDNDQKSEQAEAAAQAPAAPPEPRLQKQYRETLLPQLMERLNLGNPLAAPRIEKITISMGVGRAKDEEKFLQEAQTVLSTIAGQKPVVTRARKSVAGFGIRAGLPIGCKVTLRRRRMYEFLDRLISIVMPRIRDFRGLSTDSFDGTGNYSLGLSEHYVFPEVDPDVVDNVYGMDITICTSARTDPEARELLTLLGMPFRQQ